jgi:hypothetical protein
MIDDLTMPEKSLPFFFGLPNYSIINRALGELTEGNHHSLIINCIAQQCGSGA